MLKQNYLLNSKLLDDFVESTPLDEKQKHKLRFFTRQFIDTMSPSNFAATNPDMLKLAPETQGGSVGAGLANLMADLREGRISITDESAFEVGRNVAVSEGAVVCENELFQLLQCAPLTKEVAATGPEASRATTRRRGSIARTARPEDGGRIGPSG